MELVLMLTARLGGLTPCLGRSWEAGGEQDDKMGRERWEKGQMGMRRQRSRKKLA